MSVPSIWCFIDKVCPSSPRLACPLLSSRLLPSPLPPSPLQIFPLFFSLVLAVSLISLLRAPHFRFLAPSSSLLSSPLSLTTPLPLPLPLPLSLSLPPPLSPPSPSRWPSSPSSSPSPSPYPPPGLTQLLKPAPMPDSVSQGRPESFTQAPKARSDSSYERLSFKVEGFRVCGLFLSAFCGHPCCALCAC